MLTETTDIPKGNILPDPTRSLSNHRKGFNYEQENWRMLDAHGITYESNPQTFRKWRRTTCSNYDIRVKTVKKGWIRVECKFTLTHTYITAGLSEIGTPETVILSSPMTNGMSAMKTENY